MMIYAATFFTDTMNTVDLVINSFVQKTYTHLVQENQITITSAFVIYVMWVGYRLLAHINNAESHSMIKHFIIIGSIYGLLMNWKIYNVLIYNVFTNEPGLIAQVIINSSGQIQPGETVAQALNGIFNDIIIAAQHLFGHSGFSGNGLLCLLYGLLVLVCGLLMCIAAMVMMIYAKMGMAICLAIAPIFLIFFLWNTTRGMFNAWLNKLFTFAFIPIIIAGVSALMLSVINTTLPALTLPAEQEHFSGISIFLALSAATACLFYYVKDYAASLGGVSVGGIVQHSSGLASIVGNIGRASGNAAKIGVGAVNRMRSTGLSPHQNSQLPHKPFQDQKINDFFKKE